MTSFGVYIAGAKCKDNNTTLKAKKLGSFRGIPHLQFLHTASNQKLEVGKAWKPEDKRSYTNQILKGTNQIAYLVLW